MNQNIQLPVVGTVTGLAAVQAVNAGFTSLQNNIGGVVSVSVAGGVNVTLSAAQADNGIIVLTGALTGSITVFMPASSMQWIVSNQTTGAYQLTVSATGGAGVPVQQGLTSRLHCDGTNVYEDTRGNKISVISITPASNANVSLTAAQEAADVIVLNTGAWAAPHYVVTATNTPREWVVVNNAAYGIITFTTPAGVGVPVPSGVRRSLMCDGTNVVDPVQGAVSASKIISVTASVNANALTVSLNPTQLDFRSATLTDGAPVTREVLSATSLVVPSGATLGTTGGGRQERLAILAIDFAGVVEVAICNVMGNSLDETSLISTGVMGTGADSANVVYSASGRTNVAFRVVGIIDISEVTAGTWATAPTRVQGAGGQAFAFAALGNSQTWQIATPSRAIGTTYYNTTGRPIYVNVWVTPTGAAPASSASVNGTIVASNTTTTNTGASQILSFIVPPNAAYQVSTINASLASWVELA